MDDDRLLKEIEKVKNDKKLIELSLETEKEIFARNMLGSMGNDMKMNANKRIEPIKIKVPTKSKIKNFFSRMMSLFYS